jgi:ribonuclease HII
MKKLAEAFPFYGWEHNAGYGTSQHLQALTQYGATAWHRTSFSPVRIALQQR